MRDDDGPPPPPPCDPRLAGLVHHREATASRLRRQQREHGITIQASTNRSGRRRLAADILIDFGDPDCPKTVVPSAALMREARKAVGWTQATGAWSMGFEVRSSHRVHLIETGQRLPPRHARILLMRALRDLAEQQRRVR